MLERVYHMSVLFTVCPVCGCMRSVMWSEHSVHHVLPCSTSTLFVWCCMGESQSVLCLQTPHHVSVIYSVAVGVLCCALQA